MLRSSWSTAERVAYPLAMCRPSSDWMLRNRLGSTVSPLRAATSVMATNSGLV